MSNQSIEFRCEAGDFGNRTGKYCWVDGRRSKSKTTLFENCPVKGDLQKCRIAQSAKLWSKPIWGENPLRFEDDPNALFGDHDS